MGHYTTIARLAKLATRNDLARSRRVAAAGSRAADCAHPPAPYACPACGDESVAPLDCARCKVAFVSTADHVLVPRIAERHSLPPGAVVRAGLALVGAFTPRMALRLRERRRFRRVRRRVAASAPVEIAALPAEAEHLVHVRGRVRLAERDPAGLRVGVADATGLAWIALGPQTSVFGARGERFALRDGDTVDVLGVGRRVHRGGEAYRDALGAFVFDGEAGVDVWVHDGP